MLERTRWAKWLVSAPYILYKKIPQCRFQTLWFHVKPDNKVVELSEMQPIHSVIDPEPASAYEGMICGELLANSSTIQSIAWSDWTGWRPNCFWWRDSPGTPWQTTIPKTTAVWNYVRRNVPSCLILVTKIQFAIIILPLWWKEWKIIPIIKRSRCWRMNKRPLCK